MTLPEQRARELLARASSKLDDGDVPGARRAIEAAREILLKGWMDRQVAQLYDVPPSMLPESEGDAPCE